MAKTGTVLKTTIWNISLWTIWSQDFFSILNNGETFQNFALDLAEKARLFNISEDQLLQVILYGSCPTIRPYLLMVKPSNLKELLQLPVVKDEEHLLDHQIPIKLDQPPCKEEELTKEEDIKHVSPRQEPKIPDIEHQPQLKKNVLSAASLINHGMMENWMIGYVI